MCGAGQRPGNHVRSGHRRRVCVCARCGRLGLGKGRAASSPRQARSRLYTRKQAQRLHSKAQHEPSISRASPRKQSTELIHGGPSQSLFPSPQLNVPQNEEKYNFPQALGSELSVGSCKASGRRADRRGCPGCGCSLQPPPTNRPQPQTPLCPQPLPTELSKLGARDNMPWTRSCPGQLLFVRASPPFQFKRRGKRKKPNEKVLLHPKAAGLCTFGTAPCEEQTRSIHRRNAQANPGSSPSSYSAQARMQRENKI